MNGSNRKHENDTLFPDEDAVSVETKVAAFRFKEWAYVIMDWTVRRYEPLVRNRTQAVELMVWAWGEAHCTDESLPFVITQLQRLLCKQRNSGQLKLVFHEAPQQPFFPRISAQKEIA